MPDLVPRRSRFEWPLLAFGVAVLAAHAFALCWSWSGFPAEPPDRGVEVEVADTGFGC